MEQRAIQPPRFAGTATALDTLGYFCLCVFIVFFVSRANETSPWLVRLPTILLTLVTLLLLFSGRFFRGFSTRAGLLVLAFSIWIVAIIPLSSWRRGSLPIVRGALVALLIYAAITGLSTTLKRCIGLIYILGFTSFTAAVLSYMFAASTDRLTLVMGSFADPNAYAALLLLGLPLFVFIFRHTTSAPRKAVVFLCGVLTFIAFVKAGSRGAMIAFLCLMALVFLKARLSQKILVVFGTAILLLVGYFALPNYLRLRYTTFFTVESDEPMDPRLREELEAGAVNSTMGRLTILQEAVRITLEHPLFGVGPLQFPNAMFHDYRERQGRNIWSVSHNSYLQVSSETGVPGFIFFCGMIFVAMRGLSAIAKLQRTAGYCPAPDILDAALYLQFAFASLAATAMFLSFAYDGIFHIVIGMSVALKKAVDEGWVEHQIAVLQQKPASIPQKITAANPRPLVIR